MTTLWMGALKARTAILASDGKVQDTSAWTPGLTSKDFAFKIVPVGENDFEQRPTENSLIPGGHLHLQGRRLRDEVFRYSKFQRQL
jgi:hypothetical protein